MSLLPDSRSTTRFWSSPSSGRQLLAPNHSRVCSASVFVHEETQVPLGCSPKTWKYPLMPRTIRVDWFRSADARE